jgi:hypothetical protein
MHPTLHDSIGRQIGDEHAALHEMLQAIQTAMRERRLGRESLAQAVAEVKRQVVEHFDHEECGGYFAEALEAAPHWSERAAGLLAEHAAMAGELEMFCKQVGESLAGPSDWHALEQCFARFVARFQAHETAENELLQAAYGEDIGSAD